MAFSYSTEKVGGSLSFEASVVTEWNFDRLKGCQFLSIWHIEIIQIKSRDLLKPKNSILSNGSTFLISSNFGVRFMILRPVDTSFLRLEKLR